MKIKCSQAQLANALQIVQTGSSSKSSLMILNNVLLECEPDKLRLTTTDLEIGLSCEIAAECSGTFAITVPAKRFFSLVKELTGEFVEIEIQDGNSIKIVHDKSSFKIHCLPETEFPKFPSFDGGTKFSFPQDVLKEIINKTSYSVCRDEGRYILTGVYFHFTQQGVVAVATDGRRLSYIEKKLPITEGLDRVVIIPLKAVMEINKLLSDGKTADVWILENQILIDFSGCRLFSRLIDGHYPNFKQVIPESSTVRVDLEKDLFHRAIRRVSLLTSELSNQVKLVIQNQALTLDVSNADCGEAREEIPVKYKGEKVEIAFNPLFLQDVLRALSDETITLELSNSKRPGVIRAGKEFIYVIMPMHLA